MALALDTVRDYVERARVLLQDTVEPYRYPDADLLQNLNMAVLEARRLRPDLFLGDAPAHTAFDLPYFDAVNNDDVNIDPMYRMAFLYYMAGQAHLRDEEDTADARATVFLNKFVAQLLSITG